MIIDYNMITIMIMIVKAVIKKQANVPVRMLPEELFWSSTFTQPAHRSQVSE